MCTCNKNNIQGLCCHEKAAKVILNGSGLGLTASHQRTIAPGHEFDKYFPDAKVAEKVVIDDGTVRDTVLEMDTLVERTLYQTEKIAPLLKGATVPETLEKVWNFLYKHIQYKLDNHHQEELREPARSWHDRKSGIDCDCFSIFVSSILTNLNIKHKFRITKYGASWQHVYVIVPVPGSAKGDYWVLDCVLNRFNFEKTYTDKFDHTMETLGIPIAILSGLEGDGDTELNAITSGADFEMAGFGATEDAETVLGSLKNHLERTRRYVRKNPASVLMAGGTTYHLEGLNHAIKHWDKPHRQKALDELAVREHEWNVVNGFCCAGDYDPLGDPDDHIGDADDNLGDEITSLGRAKAPKKFFKNVAALNKKVVDKHKEVAKKVVEAHKTVGKKVVDAHKVAAKKFIEVNKKLIKGVVRYNPLTALARGGFLLVMKENWWGFAKGLYPAYLSQEEAIAKGFSAEDWSKAKNALPKIINIFVKTLQGKEENLKKNITQGYNRKPKLAGLDPSDDTLGEPYSTGASVTAASGTIAAGGKAMSNAGIKAAGGGSFISKIVAFFRRHKTKVNDAGISDESIKNAGAAAKKGGGWLKKRRDKKAAEKEAKAAAKNGSSEEGESSEAENNSDNGESSEEGTTKDVTDSGERNNESDGNNPKGDGSSEDNTSVDATEKDTDSPGRPAKKDENKEPGFFDKVGTWIKENPGKTTAGVLVVGVGLTLAFSPKARKAVGLGGTTTRRKKRKGTKKRSSRKGSAGRSKKYKHIALK